MARDLTPPTNDAAKRKRRGCLLWGLIIAGACFLLAVVCLVMAVRYVRGKAIEQTDSQPAPIPVAEVTQEEARVLDRKVKQLTRAVEKGEATTFELTASQLNALIATDPRFRELRGKVHLEIEEDRVIADASVPLDAVPGLGRRYLNGQLALTLRVRGGELDLGLAGIEVKDEPVPDGLLVPLQQSMSQELVKQPWVKGVLARIESLDVRDGKVIVRTR